MNDTEDRFQEFVIPAESSQFQRIWNPARYLSVLEVPTRLVVLHRLNSRGAAYRGHSRQCDSNQNRRQGNSQHPRLDRLYLAAPNPDAGYRSSCNGQDKEGQGRALPLLSCCTNLCRSPSFRGDRRSSSRRLLLEEARTLRLRLVGRRPERRLPYMR